MSAMGIYNTAWLAHGTPYSCLYPRNMVTQGGGLEVLSNFVSWFLEGHQSSHIYLLGYAVSARQVQSSVDLTILFTIIRLTLFACYRHCFIKKCEWDQKKSIHTWLSHACALYTDFVVLLIKALYAASH